MWTSWESSYLILVQVIKAIRVLAGIRNNDCCNLSVKIVVLIRFEQLQWNHQLLTGFRVRRGNMPEKPRIDSEFANFVQFLFQGETIPLSHPGQGQEPVAPLKNKTGRQDNRFIPFLHNPDCFVSGGHKNTAWYLMC